MGGLYVGLYCVGGLNVDGTYGLYVGLYFGYVFRVVVCLVVVALVVYN